MSDASRVAHERSSQSMPSLPGSGDGYRTSALEDELFLRASDDDSSDSGEGFADPVQDDLYARRVLQTSHQTSVNTYTDKFLPKYWTPDEDAHVGRIKQGSRRRPWYKKMQGFSQKTSGSSEEDFDVTPWLGPSACTCPPASTSQTF